MSGGRGDGSRLRRLLRHTGFRRLLIGQLTSALGDWMGTVALMVLALQLSGSTTAVGGVLVLRLLPSVVAAPLATRVVQRWERRRVMLTADAVRAGMVVVLPLVPWLGWVYFWAFAIEVVGLAFLPARDAAVPGLVSARDRDEHSTSDDLAVANAAVLATSYGTIPLGAGVFGLVVLLTETMGWGGTWRFVVVFWLDALTYMVSFLMIRGITVGRLTRAPAPVAEAGQAPRRERHGFLAAVRIGLVRAVLPTTAAVGVGLGALFSLGVVFVQRVLHAGPVGFGILVALFGAGASAGLGVVRFGPAGNLFTRVRVAVAVQGAVVAVMSVVAALWSAYAGAVLFGAAAAVALVSALTLVQDTLDGSERDLALTAFHVLLRFGLACGAVITGLAQDLVPRLSLPVLGTLAPAQTVLACSGLLLIGGAWTARRPDGGRSPGPPRPGSDRHRAG